MNAWPSTGNVVDQANASHSDIPRFDNLEALRGFCALAVAAYHMPWPSAIKSMALISEAWIFVDFFFVLSGFVIALNYWHRLDNRLALRRFMLRRFFRLYPLHLVFLLVMLAIEIARFGLLPEISERAYASRDYFGADYVWNVLAQLLLLHGTGAPVRYILNVPSWSISAEFWTYLFFALLCMATARTSRRVIGLIGALLLCGMLAAMRPQGLFGPMETGLLRCVLAFSAGALTFFFYSQISNLSPRLTHWIDLLILLCVVLFALLADSKLIQTPANLLALPIFAAIVLLFALDGGSSISKVLCRGPAQALGRWSYSIYMVHASVTAVMGFGWNRIEPYLGGAENIWGMLFAIVYLCIVLALSRFTYRWIEVPWRDRGTRIARRIG